MSEPRDSDPPATKAKGKHRSAFSVSSILSLVGGSDEVESPIRKVRDAATPTERQLLPRTEYPDASSFTFSNVCANIDLKPLETAIVQSTNDVQTTYSDIIKSLALEQNRLIKEMSRTDALSKQTLNVTHARVKKAEGQADLLVDSQRLSILAEKTYTEVERILVLFREVDSLLPDCERLYQQATHYDKLSPLTYDQPAIMPPVTEGQQKPAASEAVSALRAIQASSPAPQSRSSTPEPRAQDLLPEPIVQVQQEVPDLPAPRLRLAPRKSRANLRAHIRTVPPLPSTQLSTVLPTVERDNVSTRSSMASRQSVFSTLSYYLSGPSARRTATIPEEITSATDRLRKISGGSLLGQSRKISSSGLAR